MKPIEFKQQNITYQKPDNMTDEECSPLPAFRYDGGIISCWKMSLRERLKCLITGIVWFDVLALRQPPIWLGTDKPFVKNRKE